MALRTNKMPFARPKQGIQKEDAFLEPGTPFEQLWQAAHQGDMLTAMKLLMVAGSDRLVNQVRDYDHTTALWAACSHGHEDMARYIIAHGGDVNISRSDGATCFYIACLQGHMLVAKLLFEKGADIFEATTDDSTPIWAAASNGHESTVIWLVQLSKELLRHDHDAHRQYLLSPGFRGQTVMKVARGRGHVRVAAYIEWQLGTGKGDRMSSAPCGHQVRVENRAWAENLPTHKHKKPRDYGFIDALTPEPAWFEVDKQPDNHRGWVKGDPTIYKKNQRREPGGLCTTYRLKDVLVGQRDKADAMLSPRPAKINDSFVKSLKMTGPYVPTLVSDPDQAFEKAKRCMDRCQVS